MRVGIRVRVRMRLMCVELGFGLITSTSDDIERYTVLAYEMFTKESDGMSPTILAMFSIILSRNDLE